MYNVDEQYQQTPDLKREDVQHLTEWAQKQPHLPQIAEWQLILFLHSCYYSREKAKTTIDNYFTVRTHCPEIFGNRNPHDACLREAIKVCAFMISPKRTPEGYAVVYMLATDKNPEKFLYPEYLRLLDMLLSMWQAKNGPAPGFVMVTDQRNIVLGHLAKFNIMTTKKFLFYLQEALPVRLKSMHIMNVVPFIDKLMMIVRPFMKTELIEMLHFHTSNDTLYKFVPQECLPEDYGGAALATSQIAGDFFTELASNVELFQAEEKQLVDETRRPGKPKNANDIFGVEGSFKKLDID